jgi:hypothetical protein
MIIDFSRQKKKKKNDHVWNSVKIRPVGAELFRAVVYTDEQTWWNW